MGCSGKIKLVLILTKGLINRRSSIDRYSRTRASAMQASPIPRHCDYKEEELYRQIQENDPVFDLFSLLVLHSNESRLTGVLTLAQLDMALFSISSLITVRLPFVLEAKLRLSLRPRLQPIFILDSRISQLPLAIPMSTTNQTAGPSTDNFSAIFNVASAEYQRLTGKSLDTHPFAAQLDTCQNPEAVSNVLRSQAQAFSKFR